MVGMAHLIPILVSSCPEAPRALDVTHKRSEKLSSTGVTMGAKSPEQGLAEFSTEVQRVHSTET